MAGNMSGFDVKGFFKSYKRTKDELLLLEKSELKLILCESFEIPDFPIEILIDYLIEIGWDFNETGSDGKLPLLLASRYRDLKIVKKLLSTGANIDAKYSCGKTVLHTARTLETFKFFVDKGLGIDARDNNDEPPLFFAAARGNVDIINYLIVGKGYDVNIKSNRRVRCLHYAARSGQVKVIERLVELGADVKIRDSKRQSCIHYAYLNNRVEAVKKLLELGAPFDGNIHFLEMTCYEKAMAENDLELFKLFLKHDADPIYNVLGLNALHMIKTHTENEFVEHLLSLNLDINLQSKHAWKISPLMEMAKYGTLERFKLFLKHGANPNLKDFQGKTVLHYSASNENAEIFEFIVKELGVEPNLRTFDGKTPMYFVDNYKIIPRLIELGIDINAQDDKKQTALHFLTDGCHNYCIEMLLSLGANHEVRDINGKRPVDLVADQWSRTSRSYAEFGIYKKPTTSKCFCFV